MEDGSPQNKGVWIHLSVCLPVCLASSQASSSFCLPGIELRSQIFVVECARLVLFSITAVAVTGCCGIMADIWCVPGTGESSQACCEEGETKAQTRYFLKSHNSPEP